MAVIWRRIYKLYNFLYVSLRICIHKGSSINDVTQFPWFSISLLYCNCHSLLAHSSRYNFKPWRYLWTTPRDALALFSVFIQYSKTWVQRPRSGPENVAVVAGGRYSEVGVSSGLTVLYQHNILYCNWHSTVSHSHEHFTFTICVNL